MPAVFVFEAAEEVDFAFVAGDGGHVGVLEVDALHGEDLEVVGHDTVDARGASAADAVESAVGFAVEDYVLRAFLARGGSRCSCFEQ